MKPAALIDTIFTTVTAEKLAFSAYDLAQLAKTVDPATPVTQQDMRRELSIRFTGGLLPGYKNEPRTNAGCSYRWFTPASPSGEVQAKQTELADKIKAANPTPIAKVVKAVKKAVGATPPAAPTPPPLPSAPVVAKTPAAPKSDPPKTVEPDIVEEVTLIYSDVKGNNNKIWKGVLRKNGDVFTEWGRVGKALQTKLYPGAGRRKLEAKEREKLNKGYTRAQVVSGSAKTTTVNNGNLLDLAIKQISKGEPVLDKLVHRLVSANIHTITAHSNITFNAATGVFATPLGVVTLSAILESHRLLDAIEAAVNNRSLSKETDTVNRYLRLVPQDFGMRLDLQKMFPDPQAIRKQRDLLDTLEASYKLVTSQQSVPDQDAADEPALFDLTIEPADKKEIERIRKLYKKTRQGIHHFVANLDVETAYNIHMPTHRVAFDKHGAKMDNVWELWHGTKIANVLNILRTGLKMAPPRTAARAGALYGPGVYFSDQSTKSLNYATDYWHGGGRGSLSKGAFMFLANVAMGNYMVPKGQRNAAPPSGFDSYFAKAGQSGVMNNEMIVFKESQYLLTRLVEFA